MNRHIAFDKLGGLYVYQDTFEFMQRTYSEALDALGATLGSKLIMSGCADSGLNVASGWLVVSNQILPFLGGAKATYVTIEDVPENEQFEDGGQKTTYNTRRVKFSSVATNNYLWSDFKRFPYAATLRDSLTNFQNIIKNIVFDAAVIMSGCTVSGVAGSALNISAGVSLMDGNYVASPAYAGAFPVYLKPDATYTQVLPAGTFIKFDPYTSQYYKDVLKRKTTRSGEVILSKVLSTSFDATTGLGKWEWLGFKLCAEMKGRVPVGYWFGASSLPAEMYDAGYRNVNTAIVNDNARVIAKTNLPNVQLDVTIPNDQTSTIQDGGGVQNRVTTGGDYFEAGGITIDLKTEAMGDGTPLDVRQPMQVLAYIEKI